MPLNLTRGPMVQVNYVWSDEFDANRQSHSVQNDPKYLSISQLADRWQCSRGTVYNR